MRVKARKAVGLLGIGVLGAAVSCRPHGVFPKAPVIVVSIDTLRADHLPAYGYAKVSTPAIDVFRKDAILYENAYSHVPLTLPSHATLLTGLLPPQNGLRDNTGYALAAGHVTLAECLGRSGYATGAAISAVVMAKTSGIGRGFDFYEDSIEASRPGQPLGAIQRSGFETERFAEEWIGERGSQPFFFLLHLYEPHMPYRPPEPYAGQYPDRPYDGEIATADAITGRFFDFLKAKGLYDSAVIVVMSDHGEGLGEHGEDEHGLLLYREDLHVPLIVKLPGSGRGGTRVSRPVGLVDVFPTVAALLGLERPQGLPGTSLLEAAPATGAPSRAIYAETLFPRYHFGWSDLASLTNERYQYIHGPRSELFDVVDDPQERNDLAPGLPPAFRALRAEMLALPRPRQPPGPSDPEQVKKLAALGYIGAAAPSESAGNLPDPRDHVAEVRELRRAVSLCTEKRYDEGIAALRGVLARNPVMADAWGSLAEAEHQRGRFEAALAALERQDELAPGSPQVMLSFANQYLGLGDFAKARLYAQRALVGDAPPEAHEVLARIALAKQDWGEAEREAMRALEGHQGRKLPYLVLAQVQKARGDLAGALRTLDDVGNRLRRSGQGEMSSVHYLRGDVLARMDRPAEAETEFRKELSIFPDNEAAWAGLALLYGSQGRPDDARRAIEGLLRNQPTPRGYRTAAATLRILGDLAGAQELDRRARAAA